MLCRSSLQASVCTSTAQRWRVRAIHLQSQDAVDSYGRCHIGRRAAAASLGMLMLCSQPAHASPQLVLLDTNAAIVSQLKQRQQTQQKFGSQDPGAALASRFTGVQQQLQRIQLLVSIQQYDNARMVLRQGSFKSLRSDLRFESEYRGVTQEAARGIVLGVEQLDRQLRAQEAKETITQGITQLQQQLQQLVDAAQPQPPQQ